MHKLEPLAQDSGFQFAIERYAESNKSLADKTMNFLISSLTPEPSAALFNLSSRALEKRNIVKHIVSEENSTPCRISLKDAKIGQVALLLNYQHIPEPSPFKSSDAIFITQHAQQAKPNINTVPSMIHSGQVSIRAFDKQNMVLEADLATGSQVADKIKLMLQTR